MPELTLESLDARVTELERIFRIAEEAKIAYQTQVEMEANREADQMIVVEDEPAQRD
jgi:hypothetical protein